MTWLWIAVLVLGSIALGVWMAIAWHRYILLGEMSKSLFPSLQRPDILAYLLQVVVLVAIGVAFVLGLLLVIVVTVLMTVWANASILAVIASLIAVCVILVVFQRIGIVLPGSAIGQDISVGQAWAVTQGSTGAMIVVLILSGVGTAIMDLPALLLLQSSALWAVGIAWFVFSAWIKTLVGITILTTIYGYYVEGRRL